MVLHFKSKHQLKITSNNTNFTFFELIPIKCLNNQKKVCNNYAEIAIKTENFVIKIPTKGVLFSNINFTGNDLSIKYNSSRHSNCFSNKSNCCTNLNNSSDSECYIKNKIINESEKIESNQPLFQSDSNEINSSITFKFCNFYSIYSIGMKKFFKSLIEIKEISNASINFKNCSLKNLFFRHSIIVSNNNDKLKKK